MTREQSIEKIRKACIEANPDGQWKEHGQGVTEDENGMLIAELRERPIRLADVLLAIHETNKDNRDEYGDHYRLEITDFGMFCGGITGSYYDWESEPIFWNLRKDDLTEQSDECLEFIASLLV